MSTASLRTRIIGSFALSGVIASLIAAPAAAGGATVWVDDDGRAGPSGCGGSIAAPESISGGVDGASPGDTIKVCPGQYRELVLVDTPGLTITGVTPWTAVLRAPAVTAARRGPSARPAGDATLIYIVANNTRVQWLKLSLPSPDGCVSNNFGIFAFGADRVQIRSNRIIGGTNDNSLHCGLAGGIGLQDSSGLIAFNTVRNYNDEGIAVRSASGEVRVLENSIHWDHTGTFCGSTACTGNARVNRFGPAGGPSTPGITIQDSDARVSRNHLEVAADSPDEAEGGITLYHANVRVRANTVIGFRYGITAGYFTRGTIADNRARRGLGVGIDIYDNAPGTAQFDPVLRILDNRVRGFGEAGIGLFDAPNNLLQGNDATGNPGTDCYDQADPTESVWIDNQGDDQNQDGLCDPA